MSDRHRIPYGDSSYELKYQLPDHAGDVTSGGILIKDDNGNVLKTDTFSIVAATTLSSAVTAGASSISVADGTGWVAGDVIKLADTGDGSELVEIQGIDTSGSPDVIELADYVKFDHASAGAVSSRMLTYDLDASTTTTYTAGLELVIVWGTNSTPTAWDIDLPPQRETGVILQRSANVSGLQDTFSHTYKQLAGKIEPGDWEHLEKLVWDRLRSRFVEYGRDIDRVVEMDQLTPVFLAELAYHLTNTGDSSLNDEAARLEKDRDNLIIMYSKARIWEDSDQDDTKDDDEVQQAVYIPTRSGGPF